MEHLLPIYEYQCKANGRTVEVVHRMADRFSSWQELCEHAQIGLGDTPGDSEVVRLVGGGNATMAPVTTSKQLKAAGTASTSLSGSRGMAAPARTNKF
ncbi:MAG: zinc ribbon domain-containing protein [Gammaproteobacteria bacterium]|nr:zinc ribbon domain-containing protein [Gammaproteobacteria bacterium]